MCPSVIAFTGKMGTGKTTALKFAMDFCDKNDISYEYLKFADPLYELQDLFYQISNLPKPDKKDRQLLQFLGIHGRNIDPDIWVKILLLKAQDAINRDNLVFIDDCRFDNEAQIIDELNGIIINIHGHTTEDETMVNKSHVSENGICPIFFEYNVANIGSKTELKDKIQNILIERLLGVQHD